MARIFIPDQNRSIEDEKEIQKYLNPYGIFYEKWECSIVSSEENPTDAEILTAFASQIEELKRRGNYATADVINVSPATPGLDSMLAKFSKEHTHSEDEVRFVVKGRGIFHINPQTSSVFSVEMEEGDLINVPAGTRHWFNLCAERTICTIRLFEDTTGWTPHYIEDSVHENYSPLCFGDRHVAPNSSTVQSPVKP